MVFRPIDFQLLNNGFATFSFLMPLHKEIALETEICTHLAGHGWLHAEGDAVLYDRGRALLPPDLLAWVQETQPKAWETLTKQQGSAAEATRGNPVGSGPRPARPARHPRRAPQRRRCDGSAPAAPGGPVPACPRHQRGNPNPLPGQPAPRRAAGALLAPQRE